MGAALKHRRPDRTVNGIERQAGVAARAAERLDRVFSLDIATGDPPLEPDSLDCILFGDVLEHPVDPEAVLRAAIAASWLPAASCWPRSQIFSIIRSSPHY